MLYNLSFSSRYEYEACLSIVTARSAIVKKLADLHPDGVPSIGLLLEEDDLTAMENIPQHGMAGVTTYQKQLINIISKPTKPISVNAFNSRNQA